VFPGGKEYFCRRQGVALNPKKLAGTGIGRLPGNLEVPAYKAVWGAGRGIFFGVPGIAVHVRSMIAGLL